MFHNLCLNGSLKLTHNVLPVNRSRGSKRTEFSLLRYNFFVKMQLPVTKNSAIAVTGCCRQFLVYLLIETTVMKLIKVNVAYNIPSNTKSFFSLGYFIL